jgi:DNA-binding transcriptional LysR family regulator
MSAPPTPPTEMSNPDLNLLVALDVLLAEGSVARAARRLRLSPSAMSRTLARLRAATGDPLLVRAGRGLVPTPRAAELRGRVGQIVEDGQSVLRPTEKLDLARLKRVFTLRTSEGFTENFGAQLVMRAAAQAPNVRLHLLRKPDKDATALREGAVDLETGVVEPTTGPELRARLLFEDRYVGVVRAQHPLAKGKMTMDRYLAGRHISVSRRGTSGGRLDEALSEMSAERVIGAYVDGFAGALALARGSDLIATIPERHTGVLRTGMHTFGLPFKSPAIPVSLLWHPRLHSDPAHRWLRDLVLETCAL